MFLERILEAKRREVAERSARTPRATLERLAAKAPDPRDLLAAVRRPGLGVIAEVKRASPSRGPIRPDLDPLDLVRRYEAGGCVGISVLTDRTFFGARMDDLERVRGAVSVPVLRKDFLIDQYQIWESRAMGADAVLLIVASLDEPTLAGLASSAETLGMVPLLEVHSAEEVSTALSCGARLVGINNRDLRSFRVDLETTGRLRPGIPPDVTVVSESGISGERDASLARSWGADAVLVGEALVASSDPAALVRALAGVGSQGLGAGP